MLLIHHSGRIRHLRRVTRSSHNAHRSGGSNGMGVLVIRAVEIISRDFGVLDPPEEHRESAEQRAGHESPTGTEIRREWIFVCVQAGNTSGADGLDGFVEAGIVGEFAWAVGHGSHRVVGVRLPDGVEEAVADVKLEKISVVMADPQFLHNLLSDTRCNFYRRYPSWDS